MLTHHEMRRMMSETQRARVQNVVSTCRKHQEAQRFTIVTSAMKQKGEFAGVLGADQSDAAFTEHHAVKTNVSAECVERIQQKLASICDRCLPIVP